MDKFKAKLAELTAKLMAKKQQKLLNTSTKV
jgi:hypothetical protein